MEDQSIYPNAHFPLKSNSPIINAHIKNPAYLKFYSTYVRSVDGYTTYNAFILS